MAGPEAIEALEAHEVELAARLRLAITRLHRRLRQQSVAGLTPSQAAALAACDRMGAPTLGELAVAEAVQPPSMTRIVAALESQGLVGRVVDRDDRRVTRVQVSPEGAAMLDRSRTRKDVFLAGQLHRLTSDEREVLGELTALIEKLAEVGEPGGEGEPGEPAAR